MRTQEETDELMWEIAIRQCEDELIFASNQAIELATLQMESGGSCGALITWRGNQIEVSTHPDVPLATIAQMDLHAN